jgi:pimeloyl-ACP methyl ester carboxylesterase
LRDLSSEGEEHGHDVRAPGASSQSEENLKMQSGSNASVILVHGAWADGSSWSKVIEPLQERGYCVRTAPIPLTSLSDDRAALDRTIERTSGPVILVAHAYAGAVISATTHERVRGLVFIAALTPDEGETVADVFYKERPHAMAPALAPSADGYIWMPDEGFKNAFAQNATEQHARLLSAVQRPIALACIQEKSPKPGWKSKPSWFLIAEEDRMISPATQRFEAERMRATVQSVKVDHTPIITAAGLVVDWIIQAVAATARP